MPNGVGQDRPERRCYSSSTRKSRALQYGAEGWQLDERLAVQPEDIRVRKTTPDSFHKTELQSLLQARNVEKLVVCFLRAHVRQHRAARIKN
jgi:nicotinamidase-related amidase